MPNPPEPPLLDLSNNTPLLVAREDANVARSIGEVLRYLVVQEGSTPTDISEATAAMFRSTDTWKFTPLENTTVGLRTMGTGMWARYRSGSNTPEVEYEAFPSPAGTSITVTLAEEGGHCQPDGTTRKQMIHLGSAYECRQRALEILRAIPFWVEGPLDERQTQEIGHYDIAQELPFDLNFEGDGAGTSLKSKLSFSASWRRGEANDSPQANIHLQLQHVVNFAGGEPLYRPFLTMNALDKGVRIDLSFPKEDRPALAYEESIIYFATLFCSTKQFRA